MNLAPLADVVVVIERDPTRLSNVRQALAGRYPAIWTPSEGGLVATRPLPRSVPDGCDLEAAGFAFAEGRDAVAGRRPSTFHMLGSMPGDVGFAHVEGDNVTVVRSGAGTVPWYVYQHDEGVLVATSFTELVRLLPAGPVLDPLVCALWASAHAVFPDGRTFVRGVTIVPPGHTAELGPGRPVRTRLWWDPWPDDLPWPTRATRAEHVEKFRSAVIDALGREVADEPVNLPTLSGGADSSALAYLVGQHLGRPFAGLSFVPPEGSPEAPHEASYLNPLVYRLGVAPHKRLPLDSDHRLTFVAETPPVAFPVLHPALQVLPRLAREWGIEVLVGGEYADEICGGGFAYSDWLDAVTLPRLISRPRALPTGKNDLRAWAGRRRPDRQLAGPWPAALADWIQPAVEAEYQAWRVDELAGLRASSAVHRFQRALLSSLDGVLPMNWEACSALGVRRTFPFLTADLLQVVAACHPGEVLGPGLKLLQRRAFAGLVPSRHIQRADKGNWREEADDVLVDPPQVPNTLAGTIRQDLGPVGPWQAVCLEVIVRFAQTVAGPGC